ncbi:hypothetical protein ACEPAI_4393 [Sanghuangporus weigelae]
MSYASLDFNRGNYLRRRIHVAICGGGIGGLSLAVVLGKHCDDIQIDLYEALPQFTEIGAGISVWKRTWFIMQELGLDETLGKMAVQPPVDELRPGFCFRKGDQETEGFNFARMIVPYGSITLHRADMLKVLTDNLPPPFMFRAHFNKRLVSYTRRGDSVILHFSDGTSSEADVLAGADGIKSATRATMYTVLADKTEDEARKKQLRSHIQASWSGTYAYRGLVESESLLRKSPGHQAATTPMIYIGKNKHVVSYPISEGRVVNLVPFVTVPGADGEELDGPAVVDVSKQEMLDQYKGWEPEVLNLLTCCEKVSRWAISQVRGLPTYVDGPVVILGDAAHAMTTHIGAGASQAIEDSYILGKLLASPDVTNQNLVSVLKIYDAIRRPFGNHVAERSRMTGLLYEFNELPEDIDEGRARAGSDIELGKLTREIYKKWEIQWSALPNVEWREAERMLREQGILAGSRMAKL